MFSNRFAFAFPFILAVFLATALPSFAQYPNSVRDVINPVERKKDTSAPGVEKNGVYEETEVRHGWFSLTKPSESTPEAQFERAERFRESGSWAAAARAYHALVVTWPRSSKAGIAQQRYAEALAARGEYEDAFEQYDVLIDKYTGNFDYISIIEEQFKIARQVMNKRRGKWLMFGGWKAPERAIPQFESILRHAPRWEGAAEAQYLIANCYEQQGELEMAVVAYMSAFNRYPNSAFAEKASYGRAHCLYELSQSSPNDEESLEQAYAAMAVFINAYTQSEQIGVARECQKTLFRQRANICFKRAEFYDRIAKKPKAAVMSYENFVRRFPESDWTATARTRIRQLEPLVQKEKKSNDT